MKDYKPGAPSEEEEVDENAIQERIRHIVQKSNSATHQSEAETINERPESPDYEDLNKRFENLLHLMGVNRPSEDIDDEVFEGAEKDPGAVHYNCSKPPPDILDFTRRRSSNNYDLEEVNITLDGIEIVPNQTETETSAPLPAHLQDMVNKAMEELN